MIRIRLLTSTWSGGVGSFSKRQRNHDHHHTRWRPGMLTALSTITGYQRLRLLFPVSCQERETPLLQKRRCLASIGSSDAAAATATDMSSKMIKGRSYLERWAGIRGPPLSESDRRLQGTHSATPPASAPLVSFFGRTYLLSTFKIPPLPPAGKASAGAGNPVHGERGRIRVGEGAAAASAGAAGGTAAQSAEEERRAFEWMGRALQGKGKEAAGGAGIFPSAGSPVVLDLGAVSQDGSPHGRPASRASLAGVTKAVKVAGLVPVGVCNASHDVLKAAREVGLPEVMMVQSRPRGSAAGATVQTVHGARRCPPEPSPQLSPELSSEPTRAQIVSSDPEESKPDRVPVWVREGPDGGASPLATSTTARTEEEGEINAGFTNAAGGEGEPAAAAGAAKLAMDEASPGEATLSEDGGASRPARDSNSALDGVVASTEGGEGEKQGGEDRETMVYQGSVRSGQQVYAEGTSLVVIGAVSSGGEVMADGDIHVYGTLRGRALAGLSGHKSAKIFSTRFDAELVGVGDAFTTCHDPDSLPGLVIDSPTTVFLEEGNRLAFRSFDLSSSPSANP